MTDEHDEQRPVRVSERRDHRDLGRAALRPFRAVQGDHDDRPGRLRAERTRAGHSTPRPARARRRLRVRRRVARDRRSGGSDGEVLGLDVAPRFVAASTDDARAAGVENVRFALADVQTAALEGGFDMAFSRFGTMFFSNPVAALRNVRGALRPGGKLVMVVWRVKAENAWMYRAQQIVERYVTKPEE